MTIQDKGTPVPVEPTMIIGGYTQSGEIGLSSYTQYKTVTDNYHGA